jgi:hypothetical protein
MQPIDVLDDATGPWCSNNLGILTGNYTDILPVNIRAICTG